MITPKGSDLLHFSNANREQGLPVVVDHSPRQHEDTRRQQAFSYNAGPAARGPRRFLVRQNQACTFMNSGKDSLLNQSDEPRLANTTPSTRA